MSRYELQSVELPRLGGRALRLAVRALEYGPTRALAMGRLLAQGGLLKLRGWRFGESPASVARPPGSPAPAGPAPDLEPLARRSAGPFSSIGDFAAAYREGRTGPEAVAGRVLAAMEAADAADPPMRAFIAVDRDDVMAQARASARRLAEGRLLGPLDGVPIAIKDEFDQVPYPTTVGTTFLGAHPAAEDATVVARLRAAGALLVGKANMHEIGINPTGQNIHHGIARNPYDPKRDTGGSSSGSAAAVASGMCPGAIGADGGGSIRIPAALCGQVGLKATYGRVSEHGAAPLCWSVAHAGPIGATVADVALLYAAIAGPDPRDPATWGQPPPTLEGWDRADLDGVRLGVYPAWFEHAAEPVVEANREMLAVLAERGAQVVEIEVAELEEMRVAHAVTILSEMATSMGQHPGNLRDLSPVVRVNLAAGNALSARDYVQAQRMRARALAIFADVFSRVDLVITPATAITAPPIPDRPLPHGWSDLSTVTELMRYIVPGNLAGLPAIAFPVGHDQDGLPIAMQAMAAHWQEALLLRVAAVAEAATDRRLPRTFFTLLDAPSASSRAEDRLRGNSPR